MVLWYRLRKLREPPLTDSQNYSQILLSSLNRMTIIKVEWKQRLGTDLLMQSVHAGGKIILTKQRNGLLWQTVDVTKKSLRVKNDFFLIISKSAAILHNKWEMTFLALASFPVDLGHTNLNYTRYFLHLIFATLRFFFLVTTAFLQGHTTKILSI